MTCALYSKPSRVIQELYVKKQTKISRYSQIIST